MIDDPLRRVLSEHGGAVVRADLRDAGIPTGEIRRALQAGRLTKVAYGRYVSPAVSPQREVAHRHTAVLSGLSAAADRGWSLREEPRRICFTVKKKRHLPRAVQRRYAVSWRDLAPADLDGGRTSALRTVEDCARTQPWPAALTVADSALRCGDVLPGELSALADGLTGRHAVAARRVLRSADRRAANPLESCLRAITLDIPGLEVTPQQVITGPGVFAMVDLADVRRGIVLEAEGFEHHGTRDGLQRDCRRYTELGSLGWIVLRFTYTDVMCRPRWVRAMVERTMSQGRMLPAA